MIEPKKEPLILETTKEELMEAGIEWYEPTTDEISLFLFGKHYGEKITTEDLQ